ncbi:MAG TPA: hypothetical protein VFD36_29260 [Kofleriaceae bacterium]|nr:hypothetical protein [Kofleriaceae bacterium]
MPAALRAYWNKKKAKKSAARRARKNVGTGRSLLTSNPKRKRRQPAALRRYWAAKRVKKAAPARRRKKRFGASRASNPHTKRKKMKRRLFGAAARAHAKKLSRRKRRRHGKRRNPARKRRHGRKSSWRSRAAKKAARTRAAKKAMRRAAARKAARKRKRHGGGRRRFRRSHRKHTRRRRRRNPGTAMVAAPTSNPRRRRRRRYGKRYHTSRRRRRNPRPSSARSMYRARRTIRNRYKSSLAKAVQRRFRMRSNPSIGGFIALVKQAAPVALSLYISRMISGKLLARSLPGINRLPAAAQSPVVAALVAFGANYATKKVSFLAKRRGAVMMGVGLNLFDALFAAIAPASVKGMFGLSGDLYAPTGDYLQVGMGDYVTVDGTPIDDDITLSGMSDYVAIGLDEELGIEEELGVEEELGAADGLSRAYLGGVAQSAMLRKVGQQQLLQKIPERSFTKEVPAAGQGYDNSNVLYGGVFAGGF